MFVSTAQLIEALFLSQIGKKNINIIGPNHVEPYFEHLKFQAVNFWVCV